MYEQLNELAQEMFVTFARFEFALKAATYRNSDGPVQADWTTFAQSEPVCSLIDELSADDHSAVTYIVSHPPKKRIVCDGQLAWSDAQPTTNPLADRVLIYVRRVRNNLFHGDKFNPAWTEPERTGHLLKASLDILHHCLDVSPQVRDAYYGST